MKNDTVAFTLTYRDSAARDITITQGYKLYKAQPFDHVLTTERWESS